VYLYKVSLLIVLDYVLGYVNLYGISFNFERVSSKNPVLITLGHVLSLVGLICAFIKVSIRLL